MKAAIALASIFSILGIGMLVAAFLLYRSTSNYLGKAVPVKGTIVELVRSPGGMRRPVIEFTTRAGETIRHVSPVGSSPPQYKEGQKIDLLYREGSPRKAKINTFFSVWGLPLIFTGVGSALVLFGLSILAVAALSK